MEKQIMEIFGLQIMEPNTFISDTLMGIAGLYLYFSLRKVVNSKNQNYYSYFFLLIGISGITGAFGHSLFFYVGKSILIISWISTVFATYFFELAISGLIQGKKKREVFVLFVRIQFVVCLILTSYYANFLTVKINTAVGLLGVSFPVFLGQLIKYREKANIYILTGIALAILPAFFHKVKISIIGLFNMNDLSHMFLIICLLLIFKGLYKNITEEKILNQEALA